MSWKKVKLKQILKQYRIEHLVQNDIEYKQVTISKYDGVTFRGTKMGKEIGRKRQFQIDLKKYPNTLMFVRQGVQDGSIGIAPLEVDGCIATENMPMFSVEGINLEYLKFLLKSPYFYDELNKIQTTGSAQKSIHEREILEIEIPFPDIDEQEEIVKELSSKKDNSIEISTELTHQLTLVKKLRQQLLQDAVQGKLVEPNPKDEPASELLKKIKAEKEKLISEKKLKKEKEIPPIKPEEIPFDIPENWVWCRLGEICTKITDGFHNTPPKVSKGIPYIAATQVKSDKIDWDNCNYVDEKYHRELYIKAYPQKGEILVVNIGAGCGTPAIIDVDFEFSFKNTAILKFNQSLILNKLLFYYFLLRKDEIYAELTKGGLQPFLSLKILSEIDFPLPPIAEQNRIVQKLDELMQYCNELEASIKQSELQKEKLLQQVLREALRKEPVEV
ncbi:MAG TPA: restriction endonuclease subunit S [Bacteroidia bacterium]|nr:restriction endonuclease subunit S [Bacteroidia bacterium]